MPRTLESIVECHRVARERRNNGKPAWDLMINIKQILAEDRDNTSDEHCAAVANRIAALLRSRAPAQWLDYQSNNVDHYLLELVEELEDLRADSYHDDPDYSALEDLNNMLDRLYDWADDKRVWLGA